MKKIVYLILLFSFFYTMDIYDLIENETVSQKEKAKQCLPENYFNEWSNLRLKLKQSRSKIIEKGLAKNLSLHSAESCVDKVDAKEYFSILRQIEFLDRKYLSDASSVFDDYRKVALGTPNYDMTAVFLTNNIGGNADNFKVYEIQYLDEQPQLVTLDNCYKLLKWLKNAYLDCFLFAVVLLTFWLYEDRKHIKFSFRNITMFVLSVIFYPFIIGHRVARFLQFKTAEAILRQVKDKFWSFLSEDERAEIGNFVASGRSLKQWKRFLLDKGLIARRSFIMAMLATLLFTILPNKLDASLIVTNQSDQTAIENCDNLSPPSNLITISDNDCQNDNDFYFLIWLDHIKIFQVLLGIVEDHFFFKENDIFKKLDHIPVING